MRSLLRKFIPAVAAFALIFAGSVAAWADTDPLDQLFEDLQSGVPEDIAEAEKQIWRLWSRSGSDSMDLLLERGRRAMNAGDLDIAIEHLTALTDHAPDFAEGWNARATAFFLKQEFALSVQDIERTLALNPRHFGAMVGFGMILEATDRYKQALSAYRAAQAVHPHLPNVLEAIERLESRITGMSL